MPAGKILINKICTIYHRTLQVVYNEYNKSYEDLLQLNNNVSLHQRHLQYLALNRNLRGLTLMRTLFRIT